MNIYALPGHKVKITAETIKNGYELDQELVKKYLELEKEYEIDHTNISGFHTSVYLKEFPNISFNSVSFEDVIEQSEEDNELHPDYIKYN